MWSKDQAAKFRRALATAQKHQQTLDNLAQLAQHSPALKDVVEEMRIRRDNLETLSATALAMMPQNG